MSHLAAILPGQCDDFTTNLSVTSLTRSGTTVTATTATAHGLVVGNQANIQGAQTPIVISSLTRSSVIGTLATATDHDITENAGFNVQISGATEAEFNGTFALLKVTNRRTITFTMADSGATTATGTPLLLNGSNLYDSYNGLKAITAVPSTTTFRYEIGSSTAYTPASGTIQAKTLPRIAGCVEFDVALSAYTKQTSGNAWMFVVVGDGVANKSRKNNSDAVDNLHTAHNFNQRLIQSVQLLVFLPTSSEIAGVAAKDRCEELLQPITKSILRMKFPTLISGDNNPLMIVNHGMQAYNSAFYVHQYSFEATLQLTEDDIYIPSDDVAFRDMNITTASDFGTETFTTDIDLDDTPL